MSRPTPTPAPAAAVPSSDAVWQPPSWDEIVETHSARVYRLAYRLTGNPHDAEDLTQEVFVRVFRSLSSYTPGTFEGWLHRITTNLFLDQARRKAKIRFDALADDADNRLPSRGLPPDTQVLDGLFDDDVESALAALPPDFRAAVVLCDIEGLSYEEIADVLGLKLGTVRSRIHRGRTMLRQALAHRAPSAGRSRYSGPADTRRRRLSPQAT
ncbi:MAG: RNA polymerase sigma factor SigE [Nocardioidaceae bacterium]